MLIWVEMVLRSRRSWLLGTALFVVGCLSPTLPLPPPSDPLVTSTETAGLVRLTGSVEPESQVFAWNRSTDSIRGQFTKSGIYDFTIEAQERDAITFWYIHGTVESPSAEIVIKLEPQPAP